MTQSQIPQYELKQLRSDGIGVPPELVAVIGSSKLKHPGGIRSIAISPDGKAVASAGYGRIRLWSTESGEELPPRIEGPVFDRAAFSPDGRWLASLSASTVELWDIATSKPIAKQGLSSNFVTCVWLEFSADGRYLVIADWWHCIEVLETPTLRRRSAWKDKDAAKPINQVAMSPDGGRLAVAADDGVRTWDVATGKRIARLEMPKAFALAFRRDQKSLMAYGEGQIKTWEMGSWRLLGAVSLEKPYPERKAPAVCLQETALAGIVEYDKICVWDTATGRKQSMTRESASPIYRPFVALSQDGKRLAFFTPYELRVHIWDVPSGMELHASPLIDAVDVSPGGATVAIGHRAGNVVLWDPRTRDVRLSLQWPKGYLWLLGMAGNGQTVLTECWEPLHEEPGRMEATKVVVWDASTRKQRLEVCLLQRDSISAIAFGPDGTSAAWKTNKGVEIVDLDSGKRRALATPQLHEFLSEARHLAFTPDGTRIASSSDGTVVLWNIGTGEVAKRFHQPSFWNAWVRHESGPIAFTRDGRQFVTLLNGHLEIWEVATGTLQKTIQAKDIVNLAVSPAGERLVLATKDGKISLWNLRTGERERVIEIHRSPGWISALRFTADGRYLVLQHPPGLVNILHLSL